MRLEGLRKLGAGAGVFSRVVHALMLREARTRFGRSHVGYLWALADPLIHLATLWGFFALMGRHAPIHASMPAFLLTGIFPLLTWKSCAVRGATAIESNQPLLTYPQVRPFSVVTSRVLLELATFVAVVAVIVFGLWVFGGEPLRAWVDQPLDQLGALGGLALLGFGAAMLNACLTRLVGFWPDVIRNTGRALLFVSGVFFTVGSLAPDVRELVLLNPVAHLIDWLRSSSLVGYESEHFSRLYVVQWGLGMLFAGLMLDWALRWTGRWQGER